MQSTLCEKEREDFFDLMVLPLSVTGRCINYVAVVGSKCRRSFGAEAKPQRSDLQNQEDNQHHDLATPK